MKVALPKTKKKLSDTRVIPHMKATQRLAALDLFIHLRAVSFVVLSEMPSAKCEIRNIYLRANEGKTRNNINLS